MGELGSIDQNSELGLRCLAAQRILYSRAKTLRAVQTLLTVPLMILFGVVAILAAKETCNLAQSVAAAAAVLVAVLSTFLTRKINTAQIEAASIQEYFDCRVLEIPWNEILLPRIPDYQRIENLYSSASYPMLAQLKDWYQKPTRPVDRDAWRIMCQLTNLWWDKDLRQRYSNFVGVVAAAVVIALVATCFLRNLTFQEGFLLVLAPSLPALTLAASIVARNRDAISRLGELEDAGKKLWQTFLREKVVPPIATRALQDAIYVSRSTSPLVPDWLHARNRSRNHSSNRFGIDGMEQELSAARRASDL